MNKVNVQKFQSLLKKGTLNFSIDNIGLKFYSDTFKVGMRSNNAIVILTGSNDIISNIQPTDSWDLGFSQPSKNVNPYFDLIIPDDNDEVNIKMSDGKITLTSDTQKSNIFFCSNHIITSFDGDGPKTEGDEVFSIDITNDFIDKFNLIKKIAGSFGKIYFSVSDNKMTIETTDKTNPLSNGMSIFIGESSYDDVNICFDFKTLSNMMILLNGDATEYSFRIGYMPKTSGGMMSFIKSDNSEKYYLLSTRELSQTE